jgi:hypothetical protein
VFICAEGSGTIQKESRNVDEFDQISVNVSGNVFYVQGDTYKVAIEADDNLLRYITTDVRSKELIIDSDKSICPHKLNIYITSKELRKVEIEGSADFFAQTPITTENLSISIDGSGDVRIDSVFSEGVWLEINGSGEIHIGGNCNTFSAEVNGSGDIFASKLNSKISKAEINGSGNAYVVAQDELVLEINGSGDVYYDGNPNRFVLNINGSGKAIKIKK